MSDLRSLDCADLLELDTGTVEVREEGLTVAKKVGRERDLHLVEEPGA